MQMPLQIRELLELESMKGSELIGGKDGLDNVIVNIMVMEAPDIERWMEPGQLLLTSLFGLQNYTDAQIVEFVRRVAEQKGSGIIAKVNRFVKKIPPTMVEACDQYAIPLMRISLERRYSSIMYEVMEILFNAKEYMLNYFHDVHIRFTQLALSQPSFLQLLLLLESFIKNPAALLNSQGELICSTNPCMEAVSYLRDEPWIPMDCTSYNYKKHLVALAGEEPSEFCLIRGRIPNIGNDFYYLTVVEKNKPIESIDYMAIENAISFLQMELIKKFALSEIRQNYMNDLIDDLMSGKIVGREKLHDALEYLKLSCEEEYRFVVVQLPRKHIGDETQNKKQLQRFVDKFLLHWKHALYRIRSERVVFILRVTDHDTDAFKKKIADSVFQVLHNFFADTVDYRISIGEPCRVENFKKNSLQALRAIQFANRIKSSSHIICLNDLGIYRFLMDVSDDGKLMELIPASLKLLIKNDPALLDTLRIFLDNNQNLKKSADILYIHPKTMRYRIDKVKSITNVDFDNAEEILQYNIGFRILHLLDNFGVELKE